MGHQDDDAHTTQSGCLEQSFEKYDTQRRRPGQSMIAADHIHPSDKGYEFWGRHIAWAILQEWQNQDALDAPRPKDDDNDKDGLAWGNLL